MLRITTAAIKQFKHISNNNKSIIGFRLSLKSGGCNGFNYKLDSLTSIDLKEGEVQIINEELYLQLCKKSELYLLGTEIDWVSDVMENKFVFNNPLATASCGCGNSFTP
tara:strand:+ start:328 stop:654 length:327 start_codon:yes stop_codon:yes gene_type:complete